MATNNLVHGILWPESSESTFSEACVCVYVSASSLIPLVLCVPSATCLIYILCAELSAMRNQRRMACAPRILLQKLNLIEIYDNGS